MVRDGPPVLNVMELSGKFWPSAAWKIALTIPPAYAIPGNVACQPSSSPGKPAARLESLPVKKARSRLLAGLPSSKTTTKEAPLALQNKQSESPAIVYGPLPATNAVTSASKARLEPAPQQLVVASPSEVPVTELPLIVTIGLLYSAPGPVALIPCQYK